MNYHNFESLQEMHVELTNKCNAACPMCARNNFGGSDKEGLQLKEWSREDAFRVFSPEFKNLRNILFCGTHGDPAAAKDCLSAVEAVRENTGATIEFYSNGSIRSTSWWQDLGSMMKLRKQDSYYRNSDLGIFSIDGLGDTNHLYRRRTNFEKILENAEAFIQAGGRARWDFIVFKHNQHQVDEAEQLAKKIGFKQFRIRKTSRFAYSPDGPDKHRVLNKDGKIEYFLEPTDDERYLNKEKKNFEDIVKKIEQKDPDFLQEKVQCLNRTQFNRIYVNANLKVYPCCFISSDTYEGRGRTFRDTKEKVTEKYGDHFNSLRMHSWDQILKHSWLAQDLVESWDDPDKKLLRCQRTCSVKCNPITSQSQDKKISEA